MKEPVGAFCRIRRQNLSGRARNLPGARGAVAIGVEPPEAGPFGHGLAAGGVATGAPLAGASLARSQQLQPGGRRGLPGWRGACGTHGHRRAGVGGGADPRQGHGMAASPTGIARAGMGDPREVHWRTPVAGGVTDIYCNMVNIGKPARSMLLGNRILAVPLCWALRVSEPA